MVRQSTSDITRFGIGELYGHDFARLTPARIHGLARAQFKTQTCPFKGLSAKCSKKGGVCSLREYQRGEDQIRILDTSSLVATCPYRLHESGTALSWAGETLLGTASPITLKELPFLMPLSNQRTRTGPSAVGKIDMVLVHPDTSVLRWCALEIQAVYFSGDSMDKEFKMLKTWKGPGIPFPAGKRHPDFRSSGPKRLMPQLQIKVPTIRRWGKTTAVVIDLPFWESLGKMEEVKHVSNCDIAWFVMDYKHDGTRFHLNPHRLHLTTLDRAVEGLTGGKPTTLEDFENRLRLKLKGIQSH